MQCQLDLDRPDRHARSRNSRQLHSPGETLVTLRVIVLKPDLELDSLEKVALFGVLGVVQQACDIRADTSDCDLRHDSDSLPEEVIKLLLVRLARNVVEDDKEVCNRQDLVLMTAQYLGVASSALPTKILLARSFR